MNELPCYTFGDESTESWIFGTLAEVAQFPPALARTHVVAFQTSDFVLHWKKTGWIILSFFL